MHPALSIIFFTASSGAGFGLFVILSAYTVFSEASLDATSFGVACITGFVLIILGLFSSTLHLANPKNAWRAFSRFRTSWLAREAVVAVLFFPVALLWLAGWQLGFAEQSYALWLIASLLLIGLALATVFATGMIYACLKTIPQWHTAMTPINYIFLSLMTGSLLMLAILETVHTRSETIALISMVLIAVTALSKLIYYVWIGAPKASTMATATGLTRGPVRLLDVGHTAGTFLTEEFGHTISAKISLLLRTLVFILAFAVPAIVLSFDTIQLFIAMPLTLLGFIVCFVGVLIERWLFFAEARHVVNLYHGTNRI